VQSGAENLEDFFDQGPPCLRLRVLLEDIVNRARARGDIGQSGHRQALDMLRKTRSQRIVVLKSFYISGKQKVHHVLRIGRSYRLDDFQSLSHS
jgi:hypothetical protein